MFDFRGTLWLLIVYIIVCMMQTQFAKDGNIFTHCVFDIFRIDNFFSFNVSIDVGYLVFFMPFIQQNIRPLIALGRAQPAQQPHSMTVVCVMPVALNKRPLCTT